MADARTIAVAQITVTAVDAASPILQKIGTVGAAGLQRATASASQLNAAQTELGAGAATLAGQQDVLAGATATAAAQERALAGASAEATAAAEQQSTAASLLATKWERLIDGTSILNRVWRHLVLGMAVAPIYLLAGAITQWVLSLFDADKASKKAAESIKELSDSFDAAAEHERFLQATGQLTNKEFLAYQIKQAETLADKLNDIAVNGRVDAAIFRDLSGIRADSKDVVDGTIALATARSLLVDETRFLVREQGNLTAAEKIEHELQSQYAADEKRWAADWKRDKDDELKARRDAEDAVDKIIAKLQAETREAGLSAEAVKRLHETEAATEAINKLPVDERAAAMERYIRAQTAADMAAAASDTKVEDAAKKATAAVDDLIAAKTEQVRVDGLLADAKIRQQVFDEIANEAARNNVALTEDQVRAGNDLAESLIKQAHAHAAEQQTNNFLQEQGALLQKIAEAQGTVADRTQAAAAMMQSDFAAELDAGKLTIEQYHQLIALLEQWRGLAAKRGDEMTKFGAQVASTMEQDISRGFLLFETQTKNSGDAFHNFTKMVLSDLLQIANQFAAIQLMKATGLTAMLAGAAKGAVWQGGFTPLGDVPGFAFGGVVTGPTFGLVGEGGNAEAVIPMPDNKNVPVKFVGGGGAGGLAVHVTVNVSAIDTKDFKARMREVSREVGDIVNERLSKDSLLINRTRRAARSRQ